MQPTRGEAFAGLSVALVTPFRNGKIDFARLAEQIEYQIYSGVHGLCPVGTTGEAPTLSHDEHDEVIRFVCKTVDGRVKVMPGTGSNSTHEALRLTRVAQAAGADGALVVAPYYNKPTQEGFYRHFEALAKVGLPICVYNIPGRTAKNMEPETIIRLAELPMIQAVKEATGSLDQASQIIGSTDLTVLSGDDSMTLPLLSVGGRGVISVVANIVPQAMLQLLGAYEDGDVKQAKLMHHKLFPLCRDMLSLATNPIPLKCAMKLLGRDTGELRLPMTELTPEQEGHLRQVLEAFGLL